MKPATQMVRDYREARGITQVYISKRTGISSKRLSHIETRLIRLTADDFLNIITNGFGITPQIFLTISSRKASEQSCVRSTHENPLAKL